MLQGHLAADMYTLRSHVAGAYSGDIYAEAKSQLVHTENVAGTCS